MNINPATFSDTIAAQATPPGRGGIGIIRISGTLVPKIATALLGKLSKPRVATYCEFKQNNAVIDQGIVLYFPAPNSFTGEDVLELQGHGGQLILDYILQSILQLGARLAQPGEFSKRAFLNNKIDLVQAEAIADLIDAASVQAAKNALRSLQGTFSSLIKELISEITALRVYVEAAIDFVEEEITVLERSQIAQKLLDLLAKVNAIKNSAQQGAILREGITVVISGKPNVGKSSLLNRLSEQDLAIVTDIPGTTRDILAAYIQIDGIPIHLLDTAGLHQSTNVIEQEGMRRAKKVIADADIVLLVIDAATTKHRNPQVIVQDFAEIMLTKTNFIIVFNKIDITGESEQALFDDIPAIYLSAKTGVGIELLKRQLKTKIGFKPTEGDVSARQRHIDAIVRTEQLLQHAKQNLEAVSLECIAEDLRLVQQALGEITGEFSNDKLLEQIFSQFCVGK
jgi:tRNA modification GTPase